MSPPRTRIWKWGLPEPPSARVSSTRPASTPYFFKDMATPLRLVIQVLPSTRGKDDGTDGGKASSRRRHGGNGVRLSAGASAELGSNARDQRRVDVADGPLPGASAVYMLLRRSPRARASPVPPEAGFGVSAAAAHPTSAVTDTTVIARPTSRPLLQNLIESLAREIHA